MNKHRRLQVGKHMAYISIIFLFYVLQTTPGFLVLYSVKPALVVTVAAALAVTEGEFLGGIYGALAGVLMDTAGFGIFGFNAITLCISCVAVGLLVENLMRETLASYLIYVAIIVFMISGLQFVFTYGIWRLPSLESLFFNKVIIYTIYTTVLSPISYYLIKWTTRKFNKSLQNYSRN